MKMTPLGDIAEFINGFAFKPDDWHEHGLPIIRIQNLTDPERPFNYSRKTIPEKYKVETGDILVSWSASLGVFSWSASTALLNQHIFKVVPRPNVDTKYLRHVLEAALVSMKRHLHGATMKHINRAEFLGTKVPLPPLDEQRRIAAILDKADAIRQKRRQVIDRLNLVAQSAFQQLTNSTATRAGLGELGFDFISGKNVIGLAQNSHLVNRILKVNAISSGTFKPDEIKPMPADYSPPKKHAVQKDDILFGRASGSLDLLGVTAIVDQQIDNLYLPDKVWKLNIKDTRTISPGYALGILRSDSFKSYVRHNASGAAGVKNISRSKVLNYQAPVANAIDQQNFSAIVIRVQHTLVCMNSKKNAADALFASLQSRAFRGEL